MQAIPYLAFKTECRAAFEFYHQVLGGDLVAMVTMGEMPGPDQAPEEMKSLIMHARLISGGVTLMGSDDCGGMYVKPQGLSVALVVETPEEANRIFAAFAEGGEVTMPIQETFWAVRFGMVTDRFGTPWMIDCEKCMGS